MRHVEMTVASGARTTGVVGNGFYLAHITGSESVVEITARGGDGASLATLRDAADLRAGSASKATAP